jgi:hypothetical protein
VQDPSQTGTQPVRAAKKVAPKRSSDRQLILILMLGIAMGIVISAMVGLGLASMGLIVPGGERACAPTAEGTAAICPPTAAMFPVCPTCQPLPPSATPEPPTGTPDAAATADAEAAAQATNQAIATATAACEAFRFQFPGTPCP